MKFYVCDKCGALEAHEEAIPEDSEWECECGSHAAWEFEDEQAARDHAAHCSSLLASPLFKRAR